MLSEYEARLGRYVMGMDVFGQRPSAPVGQYFRNSVWTWHPLWDYCVAVAPDLTRFVKHGHSNDGDGLHTAEEAVTLAVLLENSIASGHAAEYEQAYHAATAAMPDEPCKWCDASGIRCDAVGQEHGMPDKLIEADALDPHPRAGQRGWCNGCNGYGHVRPFAAAYDFSVDNVRRFAAFLRASGGFRIW
jgi:hypothetical protein